MDQVTLLDSGLSDLSVPFDTNKDNAANPLNSIDVFAAFYQSNYYDT